MTVRSQSEIVTLQEAQALLGLTGPAEGEALTAAFRAAIKAARPGLPGGDELRFRRTIAAWRLIQATGTAPLALAAPDPRPAALPVIGITPGQALGGGRAEVRLGGRTLRVRIEPGLRTGDHVRLKSGAADGGDLYLPILIRPADGLSAFGGDLHMTAPVTARLLEDGGRVEIATHAGTRSVWVPRGLSAPVRLRVRDLGLPARGTRPAGHLFVTLMPSADAPSAAESLLSRFSHAWTPAPRSKASHPDARLREAA